MNLYQYFLENKNEGIYKWTHYFPVYEKHFSPFVNKPVTFVEIGVYHGGSLGMWSKFFGPNTTIIGLDINPDCKKFEGDNCHIRIGDQSDPKFLQSIIDEFGEPDIVLDDGSHKSDDVYNTFNFLYPKISKNGIYVVEDLFTSYWDVLGGGLHPGTFINKSKEHIDQLHANNSENRVKPTFITDNTRSITYYDGMIVYERGSNILKKSVYTGVAPS